MWSSTHRQTVQGLSAAEVWRVWADVNQWASWQDDIDSAHIEGEFRTGNVLHFKPKGGPRLKLDLAEVVPERTFTDVTRFPLARMIDRHDLIEHENGLDIVITVSVEGPLALLWRKLVAEDVAKGAAAQTERLVARVRGG